MCTVYMYSYISNVLRDIVGSPSPSNGDGNRSGMSNKQLRLGLGLKEPWKYSPSSQNGPVADKPKVCSHTAYIKR